MMQTAAALAAGLSLTVISPAPSHAQPLPVFEDWCADRIHDQSGEPGFNEDNFDCEEAYTDEFGSDSIAETPEEQADLRRGLEKRACELQLAGLASNTPCPPAMLNRMREELEISTNVSNARRNYQAEVSWWGATSGWVKEAWSGSLPEATNCQQHTRSSLVEATCFYPRAELIWVKIRGRMYHYCGFAIDDYIAFLKAPSLGQHYNREIKPHECKP